MAYVPPHKRGSSSSGRPTPPPHVITLDSLVRPDDSVSCIGGGEELVDLTDLTEYEVAQLLAALGLGKYAQACLDVPLRGKDLKHCKDEDLKEIGINFRPHRASLLEEVERFVREGVPASMLEVPVMVGAPAAPVPSGRKPSPPLASTDGDSDSKSSAAFSETPTWLMQAKEHLGEAPQRAAPAAGAAPSAMSPPAAEAVDVSEPSASVPPSAPPVAPPASAAPPAAPPAAPKAKASADLDQLVDGLQSLQTVGGMSGTADLFNRLVEKLEGPIAALEKGMAEKRGVGGGGSGGGAAAAPAAARRAPEAPDPLDLISARLEGLALRSEAGTAVRACRSGAAARKAAATPGQWKRDAGAAPPPGPGPS